MIHRSNEDRDKHFLGERNRLAYTTHAFDVHARFKPSHPQSMHKKLTKKLTERRTWLRAHRRRVCRFKMPQELKNDCEMTGSKPRIIRVWTTDTKEKPRARVERNCVPFRLEKNWSPINRFHTPHAPPRANTGEDQPPLQGNE